MTDAIQEMAKRAAEEICNMSRLTIKPGSEKAALAPIIARHYREGVRELVLAARNVLDAHSPPGGLRRLRVALEGFRDVE